MLKKCRTDGCDNSQRYEIKNGKVKSAGAYCMQCTIMRRRAHQNGNVPERTDKKFLESSYWNNGEHVTTGEKCWCEPVIDGDLIIHRRTDN